MALKITNFSIRDLHGRNNINIPIKDNRLILVGVNGLGKTTVINLFYFFLTRQWSRMRDFEFSELTLKINNKNLTVSRQEILRRDLTHKIKRRFPSRLLRRVELALPHYPEILVSTSPSNLAEIARAADVPRSFLFDLRRKLLEVYSTEDWRQAETDNLKKVSQYLEDNLNEQVLYLPTYRRIEQDLKAIFPQVADELFQYTEEYAESLGGGKAGYIESRFQVASATSGFIPKNT